MTDGEIAREIAAALPGRTVDAIAAHLRRRRPLFEAPASGPRALPPLSGRSVLEDVLAQTLAERDAALARFIRLSGKAALLRAAIEGGEDSGK